MSIHDKKRKQHAHEFISSRSNIDPGEIAREHRPELLVPKLALVGIFNTLENFCVAGKNSVMTNIGPINVRNLGLFLGALRGSIDLAEKILQNYQEIQETLIAEEQAESPFNNENNQEDDLEEGEQQGDSLEPSTKEGSSRESTPEESTPAVDPKKLN